MKTIDVKYIDTTPVTCRIDYDEWTDNPRDWDNLGTMILSHTRYDMAKEIDLDFSDFDGWDEVEAHLRKEHDAFIVLPVQMYEHSGISIYVGTSHDHWDGGQLGFIFVTAKVVRTWYGVKRITKEVKERAIEALTNEVDTYGKYVNGEVYSFMLEDARGEFIDSCGGWYDPDDIKQELAHYENITFAGEISV